MAGGFLLDAARVRQKERCAPHEINEFDIVDGWDEVDGLVLAQSCAHDISDLGIEMDGIDDFDIAALGDRRQSLADILEPLTEALAPMSRDHN